MIHLEAGIYVRVQESEGAPRPKPLESGFSLDRAYRVMGIFNPSETSEAFLILSNDRDEIWFISNRHVRVAFIKKDSEETTIKI
ncbi:MAG: hypothetical protein K2Q26_00375 [Bdellovibrionales bacterium]|nr:hypothetical protein [Bdellovibrionales bacterium]